MTTAQRILDIDERDVITAVNEIHHPADMAILESGDVIIFGKCPNMKMLTDRELSRIIDRSEFWEGNKEWNC